MKTDKRRSDRRIISYYLPIFEKGSQKPYGILTDVSERGFRIDCRTRIPEGQLNVLRINLEPDITPKSNVEFASRARWCHQDRYDPSTYNAGFEIIDISLVDAQVYEQVRNLYGSKSNKVQSSSIDYLWK